MKAYLVMSLAAVLLVQAVFSEDDDVDVEKLFADDEKRSELFDCMSGVKDPCSDSYEALKVFVAEAFATDCEKCSEKQKEAFKKSVEIMQTKYEDQFKAVAAHLAAVNEKNKQ